MSWQLFLKPSGSEPRPAIVPALMFTGDAYGKAEAAGAFYRSVFDDSQAGQLVKYPAGLPQDREGTVMFSDFRLGETWFVAMDSGHRHGFGFNEAISFMVTCRDQAEIDRYWAQLSSVPEAEQCGWCKDGFGVSWQVTPQLMDEIMEAGDQATIDRVTQAFLPMHKLELATIRAAASEDV